MYGDGVAEGIDWGEMYFWIRECLVGKWVF
jgi:hypothetical protein